MIILPQQKFCLSNKVFTFKSQQKKYYYGNDERI